MNNCKTCATNCTGRSKDRLVECEDYTALPPVRSEPLFCVLDAARELLAAYDEYAANPGATCERCGKARDRLRAAVNYHDTQNGAGEAALPARKDA